MEMCCRSNRVYAILDFYRPLRMMDGTLAREMLYEISSWLIT